MNAAQQSEIAINTKGIDRLLRHIKHVQESTIVIGEYLISRHTNIDMGRQIIANGMIHDQSKFHGIEFRYLVLEEEGPIELIECAIAHHVKVNPHHPEYWGNIHLMPEVYLMELVCDIKARSEEFGTDIREWILEIATEKYGFKKKDKLHKKLLYYLNILTDKPFNDRIKIQPTNGFRRSI